VSTFAHPEIVKMLKTKFVPVAIDQAYQRRQKDAEGEFYRKIAKQGPRNDVSGGPTTQGNYASTNSGRLLFYNNNRNPDRLAGLMKKALEEDDSEQKEVEPITENGEPDKRFNPKPPEGGLVLRVHTKILGGYPPPKKESEKYFQQGHGRDNFWITKAEHEALVSGNVPEKLALRMARYHLVDNTRGEPPSWKPEEITALEMKIENGTVTGSVNLKTASGDRTFTADIVGVIETDGAKITRFDFVAKGDFSGHGRYTQNPPPGKFPLGIAFELADGNDIADAIPPQASRGWVDGYWR